MSLATAAAIAATSVSAAETKSFATNEPSPRPVADHTQSFLEDRVKRDPDDIVAQNRLADIYLLRLRETGDYEWLRRAAEAARLSLASVPVEQNTTGLFVLGRVEYESHHFAAARDRAIVLTKIEPNKSRGFALLGDALLEFGDVEQAAAAYGEMQKCKGDALESETRFARLAIARGAFDTGRMHLQKALEAARNLSTPSSEIIAWCLVQSAELAFNLGQWDAAEGNLQMALAEWPEDIGALEHLAELRAAQEKYDEAVSRYEQVITRTARPEVWQALGDVYAALGKLTDAGRWHTRARDVYLKNAAQGNAHYFHHLTGFFSDVEENPVEALKWARRDLELRHTAAAQDALAWALYRNGAFAEAADAAKNVLARGTKDPHILAHAGMIYLAAGAPARGKELLAEAAGINPRHNSFHVHR